MKGLDTVTPSPLRGPTTNTSSSGDRWDGFEKSVHVRKFRTSREGRGLSQVQGPTPGRTLPEIYGHPGPTKRSVRGVRRGRVPSKRGAWGRERGNERLTQPFD